MAVGGLENAVGDDGFKRVGGGLDVGVEDAGIELLEGGFGGLGIVGHGQKEVGFEGREESGYDIAAESLEVCDGE